MLHPVHPLAMPRPTIQQPSSAPAPTAEQPPATWQATVPARPVIKATAGSLGLMVAGGTVLVLVVGSVLVSLLLATAITAVSVAVCAVVLRSLLNSQNGPRR